ncbi:EpsG family protein [Massilia kyonggiensis]|nr:EpsG family protein [Massilia kyonggiensis]
MIEYFVVYAALWSLAVAHSFRPERKTNLFFWTQGALLTCFAALRFETGYDWPVYAAHYNGDFNSIGFEPGYELLVSLFVRCGVPFKYYVSIVSVAMVVAIMAILKRVTPKYKELALAIAFAMPDIFLIPVFSVIRQTISLLILLLGTVCWQSSRRKVGGGLIVFSFLVHYSTGFIFFLVLLFRRLRLTNRTYVALLLFFSLCYVLSIDVLGIFLKILINLIVPNYSYYLDKDTFNASIFYRLFTAVVTALIFGLVIKSQGGDKTDAADKGSFARHAALLALLLPILLFNFPTFTSRFLFMGAFFILGYSLYCVHEIFYVTRMLSCLVLSAVLVVPFYRFLSSPFSSPYVPYQSMLVYDEKNSTGGERTQELLDMLDSLW